MQGPHLNTNIRNYWFHHVFFYVTPDCELGFQHSGHFCGQFLHPVRDALWCCRIFRKSHTLLGSRCWVFIFLWTGILFYLSPPELCWYPDLDLIDSFSGIFLDFPPMEHSSGSNPKFQIKRLLGWHEISLLSAWIRRLGAERERELGCGTGARTLLITYRTSTLSDLIKEKFP